MLLLFWGLLKMTAAASTAALIIMVCRVLLLKKLPRNFFYGLWLIVLVRMLVPFSLPLPFNLPGLLGNKGNYLPETALTAAGVNMGQGAGANAELVQNGGEVLSPAGQGIISGAAVQGNEVFFTIYHILMVIMAIWLAGAVFMFVQGVMSYRKTAKIISTAVLFSDQGVLAACKNAAGLERTISVYWSETIQSPFVLGFYRPKIILPVSFREAVDQGDCLRHVLLHELYHVKRFDTLIKPMAFAALCLHWWNPVLWITFKLFEKDMEISCDEKSVAALGMGRRGEYAATLLQIAVEGQGLFRGVAVTFNESSVGERVRNIMNYKKTKLSIEVLCVLLFAVLACVLLSNPLAAQEKQALQGSVLLMCSTEDSRTVDTFLLVKFNEEVGNSGFKATFISRDLSLENGQKLSDYAGRSHGTQVVQSLEPLLGTEITYYMKIDTSLVRDLVDAVGGVAIDVPVDMVYNDPYETPPLNINLSKGRQVLDGEKAEMYLRYRKGTGGSFIGYERGDLDRIEAHKVFLSAMLNQVNSKDKYEKLFAVCKEAYGRTETNMRLADFLTLSRYIETADINAGNVELVDITYKTEDGAPFRAHFKKESPLKNW